MTPKTVTARPTRQSLGGEHPSAAAARPGNLSVAPLFSLESQELLRHELGPAEMAPDSAFQIIHDELMLDGNARLNLATFVTTWMEPQAEKLMAECFDKNILSDGARFIVSEPLRDLGGAWNEVPESSYGVVEDGQDVLRAFEPRVPSHLTAVPAPA